MSSTPTPQLPQYRITLFYGPERSEGKASRVHCVFNVKKRSWKGGIQVVVEMDDAQLARARQTAGVDAWMKTELDALPEADRREAAARVPDLFTQAICALKLDLAVEAGLAQENATIAHDALAAELDRVLPERTGRLLSYLRTELDLPEP